MQHFLFLISNYALKILLSVFSLVPNAKLTELLNSKKSVRNNSRGQPCSFKKGSHRRRTTSGPPDDTSGKYGSSSSYCAPGAMEADAPATEHGGTSPMASHTR